MPFHPLQGNAPAAALLALLLAQAAPDSLACRSVPSRYLIAPDALIESSGSIVVARVLSAQDTADRNTTYSFVVERRLAGAQEAPFTLSGAGAAPDYRSAGSHADPDFWSGHGGRLTIGPDCLPHPRFEVGATYLIFRDGPVSKRSYEKIAVLDDREHTPDPQDRWLQYVENRLRELKRLDGR